MPTTATSTDALEYYADGIRRRLKLPPDTKLPGMPELAAAYPDRDAADADTAAVMDATAERLVWLLDENLLQSLLADAYASVFKNPRQLAWRDAFLEMWAANIAKIALRFHGSIITVCGLCRDGVLMAVGADDDHGNTMYAFRFAFPLAAIIEAHKRNAENPDRPGFPLNPLINHWLAAQQPTRDVDHRPKAIAPRPFFRKVARGQQPLIDANSPAWAPGLPGAIAPRPDFAQMPLFAPTKVAKPPIINFIDNARPDNAKKGHGPIAERLLIEFMLALAPELRDGRLHRQTFPLHYIVGEMLGWQIKTYRSGLSSSGQALKRAFATVTAQEIEMPDGWIYRPVMVSARNGLELNAMVETVQRMPTSAALGPGIDRRILRILGNQSALRWRAYIFLCCEWDFYVARKGKLPGPTRPEVLRNAAGVIVDQDGKIITDKKGIPQTSPYDRRAIKTGEMEDNPGVKRYPQYEPIDVLALCNDLDKLTPRNRARDISRAIAGIESIEELGGCHIEREADTPRNPHGFPWRITRPTGGVWGV